jgi:hypothetical protein
VSGTLADGGEERDSGTRVFAMLTETLPIELSKQQPLAKSISGSAVSWHIEKFNVALFVTCLAMLKI